MEQNAYFYLTRPELRELATEGDQDAQAEIQRRRDKKAQRQERLAPVSTQDAIAVMRSMVEDLVITQDLRDRLDALLLEALQDSTLPSAGSMSIRN